MKWHNYSSVPHNKGGQRIFRNDLKLHNEVYKTYKIQLKYQKREFFTSAFLH